MNAQITVSGGIIGELSEKIPSNIIALNELIKNAYDAGASKVEVILDSNSKTLTIIDDGSGMDESDINVLFYISKSDKTYGVKNQYDRYMQGSKGLGFLSVFKFGKNVSWITKKSKGLKFSANYDVLINSVNISAQIVLIEECTEAEKGTKIIIDLENYSSQSLISYLSELTNLQKVIYSFEDEKFQIDININGNIFSSKRRVKLKNIYKERQLFYVKYDSIEQKIKFYYNDTLVLQKDHLFQSGDYRVDIELMIFQLKTRGKENISPLYYNPQGDLTPLIYINTNLFNNYTIFDPNVMKNIKFGDVLNQMIGSIRIFSSSSLLSFNSDRSQFLQNELTDQIKSFLLDINKTIQAYGSKYKKHLLEFDILNGTSVPENRVNDEAFLRTKIRRDFNFKDEVVIKHVGSKIEYSFAGRKIYAYIQCQPANVGTPSQIPPQTGGDEESVGTVCSGDEARENKGSTPVGLAKVTTAKIILRQTNKKVYIPSGQIDLRQEILTANDSSGQALPVDNIIIREEENELPGGILQSVLILCKKKILYTYIDPVTGLVTSCLEIEFIEPQSIVNSSQQKMPLIYIPAHQGYQISFNIALGNLINQINTLDIDKYTEVLACTLRSTFELSIDSLRKSNKYSQLSWVKDLAGNLKLVVGHIKANNKSIGEITKSTKVDFDSLKNILEPTDFDTYVPKLHLGAHKSTLHITKDEMVKLGRLAGVFVVVTNEMLNNSNIS